MTELCLREDVSLFASEHLRLNDFSTSAGSIRANRTILGISEIIRINGDYQLN